jgi:hypothetical protein
MHKKKWFVRSRSFLPEYKKLLTYVSTHHVSEMMLVLVLVDPFVCLSFFQRLYVEKQLLVEHYYPDTLLYVLRAAFPMLLAFSSHAVAIVLALLSMKTGSTKIDNATLVRQMKQHAILRHDKSQVPLSHAKQVQQHIQFETARLTYLMQRCVLTNGTYSDFPVIDYKGKWCEPEPYTIALTPAVVVMPQDMSRPFEVPQVNVLSTHVSTHPRVQRMWSEYLQLTCLHQPSVVCQRRLVLASKNNQNVCSDHFSSNLVECDSPRSMYAFHVLRMYPLVHAAVHVNLQDDPVLFGSTWTALNRSFFELLAKESQVSQSIQDTPTWRLLQPTLQALQKDETLLVKDRTALRTCLAAIEANTASIDTLSTVLQNVYTHRMRTRLAHTGCQLHPWSVIQHSPCKAVDMEKWQQTMGTVASPTQAHTFAPMKEDLENSLLFVDKDKTDTVSYLGEDSRVISMGNAMKRVEINKEVSFFGDVQLCLWPTLPFMHLYTLAMDMLFLHFSICNNTTWSLEDSTRHTSINELCQLSMALRRAYKLQSSADNNTHKKQLNALNKQLSPLESWPAPTDVIVLQDEQTQAHAEWVSDYATLQHPTLLALWSRMVHRELDRIRVIHGGSAYTFREKSVSVEQTEALLRICMVCDFLPIQNASRTTLLRHVFVPLLRTVSHANGTTEQVDAFRLLYTPLLTTLPSPADVSRQVVFGSTGAHLRTHAVAFPHLKVYKANRVKINTMIDETIELVEVINADKISTVGTNDLTPSARQIEDRLEALKQEFPKTIN